LRQFDPDFIDGVGPKIRVRFSIIGLADEKMVEMAVRPAHDDLQDFMQLKECHVVGNLKSPPNRRFAIL